MKLTRKNYYSPKNTAISNSKVGDFLKSKEFYYRKHVLHEITQEATAPIKIGRIVDAVLCGDPIPYQVRVLKRDNPDLFEAQKTMEDDAFVTEAQYEEGLKRAAAVTREPFFQEYGKLNTQFQVILQSEEDDTPICGMIDAYTETEDTIYIDDFKSVSAQKVRSPMHWYWNCKESGYFRQMGAYSYMVERTMNPSRKKIVCRHVVVTKVHDDLFRVFLYILPQSEVDAGTAEFRKTVSAIKNETKWIDEPITWDKAIRLGVELQGEDASVVLNLEEEVV